MEVPGYRIHGEIGRGGMARVYLATQESFDRRVAIKVIDSATMPDASFAERFLREARIMARLTHPHIVPVYDVGQSGAYHYLAMEYLGGGSLKDRLRAGPCPGEAERVLREVADALEYAGQHGFVHRDVKPDNIMFRDNGSAVLMDFGISRPREGDDDLTRVGSVVGTPRYMSPEQHRSRALDTRSDLYSLGVVFYEMLVGQPPFEGGDPVSIGMAHIQDPVPELPPEAARYQPVIERLLAKDPDERYPNSAALLQALEAIDTLEGVASAAVDTEARDGSPQLPPEPAGHDGATRSDGLQEAKAEETDRAEPGLETRERKEKAGLLSRRRVYEADIVATDFEQFRGFYEQVTRELFAWGQETGKKCGGVRIHAVIHPWIAGRVREYIRKLRNSESHAFMQGIPVEVTLNGIDGAAVDAYVLEPEEKGGK